MGLAELGELEGWQVENVAARVHYRGETDEYSVEYYAPTEAVVYWRVREAGESAVPVNREQIPTPLRERIRADLAAAGIDPAVERQSL